MTDSPYQPGRVYLVRSSIDRFWWELRRYPNLEVIARPLSNTLQQELEYGSRFADSRVVAILPPSSYELPPSLKPEANITAFVWMCSSDSSMSAKAEKAYSKLAGGAYIQVDLRGKKESEEPEIAALLAKLDAEQWQVQALLERFKEKPCRLLYQLQQADPFVWEETNRCKEELTRAIESLGKPESLRLWSNISNRTLYAYLIEPGSIGASTKERIPFGMPVSLWLYMQIFVDRLLPFATHNLQAPFKLFAAWVYLASTRWADNTGRGIYEFTYKFGKFKGKKGVGFEPPREALVALQNLLSAG